MAAYEVKRMNTPTVGYMPMTKATVEVGTSTTTPVRACSEAGEYPDDKQPATLQSHDEAMNSLKLGTAVFGKRDSSKIAILTGPTYRGQPNYEEAASDIASQHLKITQGNWAYYYVRQETSFHNFKVHIEILGIEASKLMVAVAGTAAQQTARANRLAAVNAAIQEHKDRFTNYVDDLLLALDDGTYSGHISVQGNLKVPREYEIQFKIAERQRLRSMRDSVTLLPTTRVVLANANEAHNPAVQRNKRGQPHDSSPANCLNQRSANGCGAIFLTPCPRTRCCVQCASA